jgi:hypothetical protein
MYASKSRRVLVVEDDALIAWELQDLLSGNGYEVIGPIGRLPILLHYLQQTLPDADPGIAPGPAAAQQADFSGGHSRCGRSAARNARDGAGRTRSANASGFEKTIRPAALTEAPASPGRPKLRGLTGVDEMIWRR